jgi:hypothetical protein
MMAGSAESKAKPVKRQGTTAKRPRRLEDARDARRARQIIAEREHQGTTAWEDIKAKQGR